ncbi:MAG: arginine deiminase family protein [Thermoanaerobaculia bacterium]
MRLSVTSEIGRLKSVLVHLPGTEIDVMLPSMMEELLFDDILFGRVAREEHRRFQQMIRFVADEVYDLQDLLEEALEDPDIRADVAVDFARRLRLPAAQLERLEALSAETLAQAIVVGISSLSGEAFDIAPVPNLFFMRDPQVVIGDGVAISSMATEARSRESLISHYVFRNHPRLRQRDNFWMDFYEEAWPRSKAKKRLRPTIEGGDVLVPRRDILLVGVTERTNRAGVEYLASSLRASKAGVKTIYVVEIPKKRSYMHLDTVFTIINRNECLLFPPVMLPGGPESAKVFRLDLTKKTLTYTAEKSLLAALKKQGMDLEPIPCGGGRLIDQQREQWTDGANAFALSPGVIILYERNTRTAEELNRHGYHIVYEDDLLLGRTELELWNDKKYALQIQGNELSRARGGPRCMTMPLDREDV